MYPLEILRTCASNDFSNGLNSSFASSVNYGCDEVFGNMNAKEGVNQFPAPVELGGKTPIRTGFQSYSSMGNLEPNSWISTNSVNVSTDNPYSSGHFSNELSLSLATSQPSAINGSHVPDQCSEGWSILTSNIRVQISSSNTGNTCSNCKLFTRESRPVEFFNQWDQGWGKLPFGSSYPMEGRMCLMGPDGSPNVDSRFEVRVDPVQKRALEAKKTQLLTLLQVVDDRYNQCLDEIHTVVSAFHAATELDPRIHARFALQTISFLYKSLRERISNQILAMGAPIDSGGARETKDLLKLPISKSNGLSSN
ncbi:hypothetical protein GH714_030408 [Hevea brasiliensis]|uniref:POX domain-containing protein n=1 Tax=Hevea brasiliensis TaxID=3981 RepID=A0A6A6LV20_HEVBR|nr:hypothetical protein GH714_030408 [Hevea brasiliensis]